jgi:hypothetical protein
MSANDGQESVAAKEHEWADSLKLMPTKQASATSRETASAAATFILSLWTVQPTRSRTKLFLQEVKDILWIDEEEEEESTEKDVETERRGLGTPVPLVHDWV